VGTHINTIKRTNIICPRCKKIGGSLQKKPINKPFSLPIKTEIIDLSTAWDYAAKGLLRMCDYLRLFPPDTALDEEIARSVYNHYSQFTLHSSTQIHGFELTHLSTPDQNIKNRKAYFVSRPKSLEDSLFYNGAQKPIKKPPKHLELPRDTNNILRSSAALLYGAGLCCALRDFSREVIQRHFTEDENQNFADAIYSIYTSLFSDARQATSFSDLSKIMADIHNHGYHGAAAINAIPTGYCLHCYKRGRGEAVEMDRFEDGPIKWKCPKCGSKEVVKVPYTDKHLRNIQSGMLKRLEMLAESWPIYGQIVDMYKYAIENGPNARTDFLKNFKEYELQAIKGELFRRYRWIITHYDPSQKSRRKQCIITASNIANVGIQDERYKLYKGSLTELAKSIPKNFSMSKIMKAIDIAQDKEENNFKEFYDAGRNVLKVMGWPEAYIQDKLRYDISYALLTR